MARDAPTGETAGLHAAVDGVRIGSTDGMLYAVAREWLDRHAFQNPNNDPLRA